MKDKFHKVAHELAAFIPRHDDPFWNFYRNATAHDKAHVINIPLIFYEGNTAATTATFRCLSAPYQMTGLAMNEVLKELEIRMPNLKWDRLEIGGANLSHLQAQEWIRQDPLVAAASNTHEPLPNAALQFEKALQKINQTRQQPSEMRMAYDAAKSKFAAAICLCAYEIEWPAIPLTQRLGNVVHHWQKRFGLS